MFTYTLFCKGKTQKNGKAVYWLCLGENQIFHSSWCVNDFLIFFKRPPIKLHHLSELALMTIFNY